jgi:hypothetical protein
MTEDGRQTDYCFWNREPRELPSAAFGRNQNLLAQRRGDAEIRGQQQPFRPRVPAPLRET